MMMMMMMMMMMIVVEVVVGRDDAHDGNEVIEYLEAYKGPLLVRDNRINTTRKVFWSTKAAASQICVFED